MGRKKQDLSFTFNNLKIQKLIGSNFFKISVFLLVFIFTFILRAHNYDRTPEYGHLEELLYGWSGIYLIETGKPVSWSTLDYPKSAEVFKGEIGMNGEPPLRGVSLYRPWLDEPPLFSLLLGGVAHFYKADRTQLLPTSYIRTPMIFIAALIGLLVFLVALSLSGFWIGVLSMLIYGTVPVFVFGSRLAVPENLIALLFILTLYLLLKLFKTKNFLYILPLPLLAGIGGLSKPTGFFIVPLVIYFLVWNFFKEKQLRKAVIGWSAFLFLATVPFVLMMIWFGISQDAEIFWRIFNIQGQRPVGFSSLGWFFTSPAYDINLMTDCWYIFSLLCLGFFIFKNDGDFGKKFITFSAVYWLIIVMLSGGEGDLLPWYRYPVFPLLAILTAWGLQILVKRADFLATFLTGGLLLGNRALLVNAFHPNLSTGNFRLIFSLILAPSLIGQIFEKEIITKVCRALIVLIICVGVYINCIYIYNQFELMCESKTCPIGPSTKLSEIYFPVIWKLLALKYYQ